MARLAGLVVTAVVLAAGGCVGPSAERFALIEPGRTTRQEVVRLLGEPSVSAPGQDVYLGRDGRQAVLRYDREAVVSEALWWPTPKPPAGEGGELGGPSSR